MFDQHILIKTLKRMQIVEEECSKYDRVKHIFVDKRSAGFVYWQLEIMEASM